MSIPGSASPLFFTAAADAAAAGPIKSVRFNTDDSSYLNRTPSSNGNKTVWTLSCWIKLNKLDTTHHILTSYVSSTNDSLIKINGNNHLEIYNYPGSYKTHRITNAKFRDPSAWYHIVVSQNGSTGINVWVNGVAQTFSTSIGPDSSDWLFNSTTAQQIGRYNTNVLCDYQLADFYWIDGEAKDKTDFGAYDDNGVWQAAAYSGSFGTNGFHLFDFASESGIGNDSSGNDNDFSVNNLTALGNFGITKAAQIVGTSKTFSFPITYTTTLTYEFFVRITTDGTYNYMAKLSNDQWNLGTSGSSLLFGNYNGGWTTFSSTGLNDSEWHFVRLTTTGSSTSLYVDGSLIATNSSGGSVSTGSEVTNEIRGTGSGAFEIAHLRITTGGTPPTTGVPNISDMNAAAGSGGTLVFYDKLDDIASSGTKTSDGGNVTITMSAATVGVTAPNTDVLFDVPTNGTQSDTGVGGEVSGNYPTWNPLSGQHQELMNGNLEAESGTISSYATIPSTIAMTSGKWYAEFQYIENVNEHDDGSSFFRFGISQIDRNFESGSDPFGTAKDFGFQGAGTLKARTNGSASYTYTGNTVADGDILSLAFDADAGKLWVARNGTWATNSGGTGDPANGNNPDYSSLTYSGGYVFVAGPYAGAASPAQGGGRLSAKLIANWGQRSFAYSAPSGFKALNTASLPTPTIANGRDHFDIALYTGNGGSSTITVSGLNFSPNLVWLKGRSDPDKHGLYDTVRGATKLLIPSSANGESTQNGVTAFNSDGFDIGNYAETNGSSRTYVAWAWNVPGSASSNSDGTITSSVTKNADAGISIVTWTGDDSSGTIGHGLGSKPDLIIVKVYGDSSYSDNWPVYSSVFDGTHYAYLNDSRKFTDFAGFWNDGTATSTVFPVGDYNTDNTKSLIGYCFTSVAGFSSIGSYEGNGSSNGPFVFTGMRPALVLARNADTSGEDWWIVDTTRETFNPQDQILLPNSDNAEITTSNPIIDILSNGFKLRNANARFNASGTTYVYASFASNPFQANGGLAR